MTNTSNCIDSISVSKERCNYTMTDRLRVAVTLRKEAVLAVTLATPHAMIYRREQDEKWMAERRRREVAHAISHAFTAEIEDAVARMDACALSGETVTIRKGGYA